MSHRPFGNDRPRTAHPERSEPSRDWRSVDYVVRYVDEIRHAIAVARAVVERAGDEDGFVDDDVLVAAAVMSVQRIGEGLKKIEHHLLGLDESGRHPLKAPPPYDLDQFNADFPGIEFTPWIKARDFLSHGYADLDPHITWATLVDELDPLDDALPSDG